VSLDYDDKAFFVGSILGPLLIWWVFYGRKKYGTKGMR
jgi:hypothetical protein